MGAVLMDIKQISEMLSSRIGDLCQVLLPLGVRDGHEWRVGGVDGSAGRSMAVHIRGSKAGVWADFASGEGGDPLDLVAAVMFRGDLGEAVKWARSWLGLDNLDPNRLQQRRQEAKQDAQRREDQARAEEEKMLSSARRLWHCAQSNILPTPVYQYLLGRAIDVNALKRVPGALRYEGNTWNSEVQGRLPAMVACIQDASGKQISTHRTWLKLDNGLWRKNPDLKDAKKTLAPFRGGYIPLNRGISDKPIKEAPPGDHVFLAEGIETGLSLAVELPEMRVLAAVSSSNFQNIELPVNISKVTIAADNDGDNKQTLAALDAAIGRFVREGREVKVIRSTHGKDFNDLLQWQKRALIESARAVGARSDRSVS
jgi:hypothetical protein